MDEPWDEPTKLLQNVELDEQDPQSSENIQIDSKESIAVDNTEEKEKKEEEALTITSEEKEALLQKELGNRFVKLGQWEKAAAAYSKAIENNPRNIIFYSNRALCYLKMGWYGEAERDCTIAISLEGSFVKAYYRRAQAYINLKRKDDAINDLQKILTLDPENKECKEQLDILQGCPKNVQNIKLSEEEKKKYVEELMEKARSSVEDERWLDAIKFYSKACQYNKHDPSIYLNRAVCEFHCKRFILTVLDCSLAIELNENYTKAYYWSAKAKVAIKYYEQAKQDLLKGLKLEPENEPLKKMLKYVESLKENSKEKQTKKKSNDKTEDATYDFMGNKVDNPKRYKRVFKYIQEQIELHRNDSSSISGTESHDHHIPQFESLNMNECPKHVAENKSAFDVSPVLHTRPRTYKLYDYHYFPQILKDCDADLPIPFVFYEFEVGWNSLKPHHTYERLLYFLQINPKHMGVAFNELCAVPSWLHLVIELMIEYSNRGLHFYDHIFGISQLEGFKEVFTNSTEIEKENVRNVLDIVTVNEPEKDIKRLKEIYSFVIT